MSHLNLIKKGEQKMVHLITGYKGYEHIKSADQGRFNASFYGTSEYVMESGNQCKAEYINNNTVRILDGDILMQGRHISIEPDSYEDLTITTGTSGYNRADLIVMTYTENEADGIEDAYLEVIQGTETTGTATLPTYTSGNILAGATYNQMPLYRVDIVGVTLQPTITPLYKSIPTFATLAEEYEAKFIQACENHLDSLDVFDTMTEVKANTTANQLAGALALKEYTSHTHDDRYFTETEVDGLLKGLIATQTFSNFNIDNDTLTTNVSKTGYTPIGVIQIEVDGKVEYLKGFYITDNTLNIEFSSVTTTSRVNATVLYMKK